MSLASFWLGMAMASGSVSAISPDDPRCWTSKPSGSYTLKIYIGDRNCLQFAPEREYQGIWINQFEGSRFVEGATSVADARADTSKAWLQMDAQTKAVDGVSAFPRMTGQHSANAYFIRFKGQQAGDLKSSKRGGFGHFGMSSGIVIVNQVIEITDLGPTRH